MFVQVDRRRAWWFMLGGVAACRVYDGTLLDAPALSGPSPEVLDSLGGPILPAPPSPIPARELITDEDAGVAPSMRAAGGSRGSVMDLDSDAGPAAGGGAGSGSVAGVGGVGSAAGVGGVVAMRPAPEQNARCAGRLGFVSPENGHCYFALMERVSWNVARDFCLQADARLATITDQREQSFVAGVIDGSPLWIGLSRFGSISFSWLDGSPLTYAVWKEGAPAASGDRGVSIESETGEWVDASPKELKRPLCER